MKLCVLVLVMVCSIHLAYGKAAIEEKEALENGAVNAPVKVSEVNADPVVEREIREPGKKSAEKRKLKKEKRQQRRRKNKQAKKSGKKNSRRRKTGGKRGNKRKTPKKGGKGDRKNKNGGKRDRKNKKGGKKSPANKRKARKLKKKAKKAEKRRQKSARRRTKTQKGAKSGAGKNGASGKQEDPQLFCPDLKCVTNSLKLYIKWRNNLTQSKRITKFVTQSQNKREKAAEFANTSEILLKNTENGKKCNGANPDGDAQTAITDLPNCAKTAAEICNVVLTTDQQTKIDTCKPQLEAFLPAFETCYKAAKPDCKCFEGITAVPDTCDGHIDIFNAIKVKKDACVNGSGKGSFSYCRKQQINLGPIINQCRPPPIITTPSSKLRNRNIKEIFKFKHFDN